MTALSVRAGVREGLATAPLRRLELSWLASSVASWAFMVILAVFAYQHGGATAVGVAAVARMVPAGLAAPFAGLLADRRSRRNVLLAICAVRAVALGAVALLVALGGGLAPVLALAAVITALATAHKPAQAALLPLLARTPRQLGAANALWSATDNAGFLIGALLGGLVVAAIGTGSAFALAAGTFAVAAALLLGVPADAVPEHRASGRGGAAARELVLGMREVVQHSALRRVVAFLSVLTLVEGTIDVLLVVVAFELLDLGSGGVGWLNAWWGIGGVAGGLAALTLLGHGRLAAGLMAGTGLIALGLLAIAGVPASAVAVPALAAVGIGYALVEVAGLTLLQRLASDEVLGRAFAVVESEYWLATGAGAMIAPALVGLWGVRGALAAAAALLIVVAACWHSLARLEAAAPVPEREFGLLRSLPLFAPLPLATIETLACRLVPVELARGEVLIREGDSGDRFYIVAEGRMAIEKSGRLEATAGPGDFFGEIALLRDCLRTASVTAAVPGLAFALERADFLDAVTGSPRALQAADRVVEARNDA